MRIKLKRLFIQIPLLAGLLLCLPGQTPPPSKTKVPVATIAGQPVYEDELMAEIQGELQQLRNEEYTIKSRALEGLIDRRLLEAEAAKRGISVEKLVQLEIESKIVEPSEADIQAFYQARSAQINRPLKDLESQIRDAIRKSRADKAHQDYVKRLREKTAVAVLLRPPRVEVSHDPARVRGNRAAPVMIVEFSEFQCPFCQRVQPTLRMLLEKYAGKVSLAYRDFPLRQIHGNAQSAAEAARCAGEKGKFWEYHDLLFANPSKLDAAGLAENARTLGLDVEQFRTCLGSGKYRPLVEADLQEGGRFGITGAPAFFINGIYLAGAQPAEAFEKIIDAELAALNAQRVTSQNKGN